MSSSFNIIPDELLNHPIMMPAEEIIKYGIHRDESPLYPSYKFIDIVVYPHELYSVTIVRKDNLDNYYEIQRKLKLLYEEASEDELIREKESTEHLRTREDILYILSRDYSMSNYHYIYFDTTRELEESEDEYIINNFILKYSYPSCMNINYDITSEEKIRIIDDEFNFMKDKLYRYNPNIILIQVPRVIYCLYNIYIHYNAKILNDINIKEIQIESTSYKLYCDYLLALYKMNINYIRDINRRLIVLLYDRYIDGLYSSLTSEYWIDVLNSTIDKIYRFTPYKHKLHPNSVGIFLEKSSKGQDIRFTQERNRHILYTTLLHELKNYGKDIIILYRGSGSDIERVSNNNCTNQQIHSYSYNTSVLNAILSDMGACTLNYYKTNNHKYYYIVKKHFYNDGGIESDLFWIPPIHPVLLIKMKGELFHARSKIPIMPNELRKLVVDGLAVSYNIDFLLSNLTCEEMLIEYAKYIRHRFELVDKYYNKYLIYKNKFLNLRSKLRNLI
jgi:hypothetical protein